MLPWRIRHNNNNNNHNHNNNHNSNHNHNNIVSIDFSNFLLQHACLCNIVLLPYALKYLLTWVSGLVIMLVYLHCCQTFFKHNCISSLNAPKSLVIFTKHNSKPQQIHCWTAPTHLVVFTKLVGKHRYNYWLIAPKCFVTFTTVIG